METAFTISLIVAFAVAFHQLYLVITHLMRDESSKARTVVENTDSEPIWVALDVKFQFQVIQPRE